MLTTIINAAPLALLAICLVYICIYWDPDIKDCEPGEDCHSCPFPCDSRDSPTGRRNNKEEETQ